MPNTLVKVIDIMQFNLSIFKAYNVNRGRSTISNFDFVMIIGTDANEIIGKWKQIDVEEKVELTCEKSGVSENNFKCTHEGNSVEVEWQNKVYYMADEKHHWTAGAITNDEFTWSFFEKVTSKIGYKNIRMFWKRVGK